MDDLISRTAAWDALNARCEIECDYSRKQRAFMCSSCKLGSAFEVIEELPTIAPDTDPITQKALEAGKRGEEVKFYIGGRKFAVRELAQ